MLNKCKNYRIRTKQGNIYFYCTAKRTEIPQICTKGCELINYRSKSKSTSKRTKKANNKVTPETYKYVFERDKGKCRLCGSTFWLEEHHIFYKSQRRDLINEPTNLILLCKDCHLLVHSNKKKYQPMLLEMMK